MGALRRRLRESAAGDVDHGPRGRPDYAGDQHADRARRPGRHHRRRRQHQLEGRVSGLRSHQGQGHALHGRRRIGRHLAPDDGGLVHTGPEGSGHFVKMVHNGVEYGLMQAYAEGFQVMKLSKSFPGMDMRAIAEAWRTGSVVRSWLLDLIARGLAQDPELTAIKGWVEDTGEGRWTVETAIEESVPTPIIAESLFARFRSRMENTFGDRMLAMMRAQFGGHAVVKDAASEK